MTTCKFIPTFLFLTVFLCKQSTGQDIPTIDFYNSIKKYDLTVILTPDSFLAEDRENNKDLIQRAEPLGFIGDNFQRFYIHFTSMTKNPGDPYEYIVAGKTKVKNKICSFQGTIKIISSKLYKEGDVAKYKQGYTVCELNLFEDKSQSSSGFFKGNLTSNFIIDDKQRFRYDALSFVADGFSNNEFTGTWTSYKSNTTKVCNWGDYRIPKCGDLDIGAGEFSVDDRYLKNGWENYRLAYTYDPDKPEVKKAKQIESEKWWQ